MDLHRLLRSLSLLIFILATYFSNAVARQHRHKHGRQRDKRFQEPGSYVTDGDSGPDRGPWGPWSEEGSCSRTCGGGVAYQTRTCTSAYCEGPTKRYISCNIQDCPEGSKDFRAEQCALFNTEPFDGVYYDWIPYIKAPNKCELNCMPKGERFYYRHRDKVVDGTRCEEEKLDVCVNGKCLPVGCDMMLGSPAREDKCRECGGDNSGCTTFSGILHNDHLQVGYNDILLIPAGAINIKIREVKTSNNYLAIRNTTGHYYLNGNWRIDFPRSFRFAGTIFHYERKPHAFFAPETITCLGPTIESLYIVLLYQETNPGVEYEYSIPKGRVQETDPDSYVWVSGDFGPCSATCGGGTQERKVWCARRKDLSEVSTDLCDSALQPSTEGTCATEPCSPQWAIGDWTPCSQTCGLGSVQTRQVICEQIVSNGRPSLVDNSACEELLGAPPATKADCPDVPCPVWHIGPWSPCDKLCGEGKQRRKVRCYTKTDERIQVLGDSACPAEKPETEMVCRLRPCEGLDWIVSEWSGCEDKCGLSFETREAHCATQNGEIYPDNFCLKNRYPKLVRECENPPSCRYEWFTSQWSECSVKCGAGIQTRKVFCGTFDGEITKKVEDAKCDAAKKYEDTKNCTGKEECKGHWFTGPWSACSKPCGGGLKSRKVLCLLENKTAEATSCDAHLIPFSNDPCNNKPCGADEIVPLESTHPIAEEEEEICDEDYEEEGLEVSNLELEGGDEDDLKSRVPEEHPEDPIIPPAIDIPKLPSAVGSSTNFEHEIIIYPSSDAGNAFSPEESSEETQTTRASSEISSRSSGEVTGDIMVSDQGFPSSDSGTSVSSSETSDYSSSTNYEDTSTDETSISSETISSSSIGTDTTETTSSSIIDLISSTVSSGLSSFSSTISSTLTETSPTDASSTESPVTDVSSTVDGSTETDFTSTYSSSEETSTIQSNTSPTDISSTSDSYTSSTEAADISSTLSSSSESFEISTDSGSSSEGSTQLSSSGTSSIDLTTEHFTTLETESSSVSDVSSTSETGSTETSEISTSTSSIETTLSSVTDSSSESTEGSVSTGSSLSTDELLSSSSAISVSSSSLSSSSVMTTESLFSSSQYDISSEDSSPSSLPSSPSFGTSGSSLFTTSYTDSATTVSYSTDFWSSTQSSAQTAVITEKALKKCKKKKKPKTKEPKCVTSEFGCCTDNVTEAQGPFNKGCPQITTCKETKFGCCHDGVSPAFGKDYEGCPPSQCNETLFGCCPDHISIAEGNDYEGCPEETTLAFNCSTTQFGCCPNGFLPATGPNFEGCSECEGSGECEDCSKAKYGCCPDGIFAAIGPNYAGCELTTTEDFTIYRNETTEPEEDCKNATYGCCPDGLTPAIGENNEGCPVTEVPVEEGCSDSEFGCCPDGNTTASGPNNGGCPPACPDEPYGCCDDNKTPAHGPNKEGCCLNTPYGCCPDNILPAQGPNLEGCGCRYSTYGCCPDNSTAARGPNNEGCGCQYTEHGCCPNKYTPAAGPNFQGCPCHTHQFGCCPDGITRAKGPHLQGCGCENTEFGCCPDGHTPASGPDRNCTCEASTFGCCPDGINEASGERFEGCAEIPLTAGEQCTQPKDRGPCRDFTVKWFFDTEYGGCARFWYGGCGGNENRFRSQEECSSTCVELKGREACTLPKIEGPCEGYYPTWYYDTERKQCGQFIYGGCLGNNNNFETREACHELCVKPDTLDACEQSAEKGICQGNFTRWYYNKEQKTCLEFTYGGCKANGNNFLTELACQQKCLQPGRSREQDTCSLPVVPGDCQNYTEQWYYDVYEGRCKPFYYGGCGGNQNRFNSEIDCQHHCDHNYITSPVPPVTFTTDMCFLPVEKGPCTQSEALWYYDSHNGVCAQFIYGGCEGNANRFQSRQECEQKCGEAQDICTLPRIVGPCSGNYQQWYYDPTTDSCHQFDYGGCQGNSNRFNTEAECEQKCRKSFPPPILSTAGPPAPPPPTKSSICYTPVDSGPCRKEIPAWYFNSDTNRCQLFIYGGCEGNANRFDSEEQCERHCGEFQGLDVCKYPQDVGPCTQNLRKWYFDSQTMTCQEFLYGGCYGSANRFSSDEECRAICLHREEIFPTENTTSISHIAVCKLPVDVGPCTDGYYKRWFYNEAHRTCEQFDYGGCAGNLNRFKNFQICIEFCASLATTNEIDTGKEECENIELACSRFVHCEFGTEHWIDNKGCENCRCHNPCITSDPHCPPNTTCSVEKLKNEITEDIEFRAVCRPVSKDGECPHVSATQTDCNEQCKSDADCPGDAKCCYNGCATSCIPPQAPVTYAPSPQPPPNTFNVPGASPPEIEETEPEVEGEEGNMVTLRCTVRGSPTPTITWYKGDQKLGDTGGRYKFQPDGSVQIIGLYRTDAGVYVCVANNRIGPPVRREIIVIVKDPVQRPAAVIGDPGSSVVVTLGSQAVLQCFTIGWPRPAVTWWRGSRMLPLNSEQYEQRRDHSLLLHSVTLTALGFYTCQAYNGLGSAASWTVTLKAIGPVYSSDPNDVTYNQFLVPPPRTPPATASGGHPLPPPYRPPYPPAVRYTVTPEHPFITTEPPTPEAPRVFVVPVKTNISLDQSTYAVGSDISIPCDVDGYPVPHVTWYKDGKPIEISEKVHITESSRLMIIQANSSDSGMYRCHASNAYSSADSSVSISVEGVYVHPNCTDNPFFANCNLIVKAQYCTHIYYARFCCKSCTQAGQLPSFGAHLSSNSASGTFSSPNNLFRRRRSLVIPRH
ncbi:proteoglycan-like sulfated glycoprotein papilin isoform X2 [Lycorma delicatula]|uniref:proteoglycan-like sulfated glycoprotein papilin isoform X2 n=1 Tax=Lycorma delicatula TaxID=130591 RepID=UPI003F515DF6